MAKKRSNSRPGPGRPPVKRHELAEELRKRIVSGEFPPCSALPTRNECMKKYDLSSITVHHAFQELIDDGFVESKGRRGTFVVEYPPHGYRFGVTFPVTESHLNSTLFYRALSFAARERRNTTPQRVRIYAGVRDIETERLGAGDHGTLLKDVEHNSLAGLLMTDFLWGSGETEILSPKLSLPRMLVSSGTGPGNMPTIYPDYKAFFHAAFSHLKQCNRKHIAVIGSTTEPLADDFLAKAGQYGLSTKPYWHLELRAATKNTIGSIVHLLMHSEQKQRPDALLISDDHLLNDILDGLASIGRSPGKDLDIVSWWNFPNSLNRKDKVCRMGLDSRILLSRSMEVLTVMGTGRRVPGHTILPIEIAES